MSILDSIRSDIEGMKTLHEWTGGIPVSSELAYHRSFSCVFGDDGKPCKHNRLPNWWETAKGMVAGYIRREMELKHKLKLETKNDGLLAMCDICGCCLQTKIFVPIKIIESHLLNGQLQKMPSYCWMKSEINI